MRKFLAAVFMGLAAAVLNLLYYVMLASGFSRRR